MARRATSTLAALLACAAAAVPAVLAGGQLPAAAANSARAAQPGLAIVITGMTPQWATATSTITVTGSLRNTSHVPTGHLTVQLLGSATPIASVAELQLDQSQAYSLATTPLPSATWQSSAPLAPAASVDWSIRIHASTVGMTAFGVYPLAAQAQDAFGTPLATAATYLPYEPDRKGQYAGTRPSPAKTAWLWPLVDKPLLNQPWQGNCSGPQAVALAASIAAGGRLAALVRAGATDNAVTWIVDPALLANVRALATCRSSQPKWAAAAASWLALARRATTNQPLTVTPYGNPNVAALIAVGHGADVARSFDLGRSLAGGILGRNLIPDTTSTTPNSLGQADAIAWSAVGVPSYSTLENLANVDDVRTLVLSTAAFPAGQASVLRTLDGGGSYMTALLASQSLTQLLGSRDSAPGSGFATSQQFLAETTLLAQQVPAQPIIVAPPPSWDPQAGLANELLTETASAPWLRQASLTSLIGARHIQSVPTQNWPAGSLGPTRITRSELRKLRILDHGITELQGIRARPDPDLYLAVSALESSAWQGTSNPTASAMLATVVRRIFTQQQAVQIVAEKRITLGGLRGGVPVSIDNRLGYAVRVQLQLQYNQSSGIKITADPQGLVTVPPHQTKSIRLRVQATQVGSTTVTLMLASQDGQQLSAPQRMTIQATQVGVLGMIIFAAALGIFLIASAARAIRRGRPGTGPDKPAGKEPPGGRDDAGSADRPQPDTVEAERSELGAVGKPGP